MDPRQPRHPRQNLIHAIHESTQLRYPRQKRTHTTHSTHAIYQNQIGNSSFYCHVFLIINSLSEKTEYYQDVLNISASNDVICSKNRRVTKRVQTNEDECRRVTRWVKTNVNECKRVTRRVQTNQKTFFYIYGGFPRWMFFNLQQISPSKAQMNEEICFTLQ